MSNLTIKGSPIRWKLWRWINLLSVSKMKKHQDLVIDVTNIILPTPSTMIIKFTIINTGKKYELINQGRFSDLYKKQSEGESINKDVNFDIIISDNFKFAYEIN